jgi:class 3 adenylate cyclase/tetratricopeptide (TPR) repeat protein
MPDPADALQQAIAALEAQRGLLGHATVDAALQPLRERLAALHSGVEQQLRQVSVLFIDVAGSTALSRGLDPEDVHELMDGALQHYAHLVRAQGGRVLQYAGDNLLAAFGSPLAREDDAERAVQAALAVLAAAAAATGAQGGADRMGVRAGIATGPVLLGGGVDGEASIRGAVVNLAARMEQTAPVGALRICPDTRRLVRGLFQLSAQPPLRVKGYDEPIATWLVQGLAAGVRPQATRGVGGLHTPLVGRHDELAALQGLFRARQTHDADTPAMVVVLGDAGLGKSRLAAEFRAWTRGQPAGAYWLEAHASERASGQPYGLLRQLFTQHLGLLDSDSAADARATWLQGMAPLLQAEADAAVLGHLLGLNFAPHPEVQALLSESRQLRDRAFFHATQALRRIGESSGPLALFLDDLQWADPGTLDFIDHLQRSGTELLMLLCSSRPALEQQRPGWAAQPGRQRIELAPLAGEHAAQLADALLARLPQAPATLRQRLIDGAEGNPFYMEELVNMLIDRGVIVEDGEDWRLGEQALDAKAMPRTLAGVLQARLDELPPAQAHALQLAAVVGHVFWAEALAALAAGDEDSLSALLQRQFIVARTPSTLAGQDEYAFRHHLLHQVCYERVLRRTKVPAHAQVAQWLAAQPGERPLDLIAEHHERGGQPAQALDAWQQAAEAARARYANTQALTHAERALALVPATDLAHQYALRRLRVLVLALLSQPDALMQELDALDELALALGDDTRRAEATCRRAVALNDRGEAAEALRLATQAYGLAGATAPRVGALAGLVMSAALSRLGRGAEARQRAPAALALAREAGDSALEGALLNELGNLADEAGDFDAARSSYGQALALHRRAGHRSNEAGTLSNLGYLDLNLGDYEAARDRLGLAREIFARIGQRGREGIVLINLALVALHSGDARAAAEQARAAQALLAAARIRWAEAAARRVQGQAALAMGDAGQAAVHLSAACDAFVGLGLAQLAVEAQASLAQVALSRGDLAQAMALAEAVLAELQRGLGLDGTEEPLRVHLACWQALHAAGDARAGAVLHAAWQQLDARAAGLQDETARHTYLQRVPHHRALLQAWAEHGEGITRRS